MKRTLLLAAAILCISTSSTAKSAAPKAKKPSSSALKARQARPSVTALAEARASYGRLPLAFEENTGQSDSRVKFTSRGAGYNLFLTADEAVLALWQGSPGGACSGKPKGNLCPPSDTTAAREHSVLWLKMLGANPSTQISGLDELQGKTNYFTGNDPRKWHTNVANFEEVSYRDLYPGVDLVYYGNQQQLESDFILAPGADPGQIQFEVQGAIRVHVDALGNLVMGTNVGDVRLLRPGIYQMVKGARREVAGHYVLRSENRVGFEVAAYDATKPLVIDPTLVYATFLGGSGFFGDTGKAITVDASGNAYVTGQTSSPDFPGIVLVPTAQQSFFPLGTFVTKFNAAGNQVLYSAILSGSTFDSNEGGYGIGVDGSGNAYIIGTTAATNFPMVNPFQATFGAGFETAFVAKLSSDGASLLYSTYLGGRNSSDQTDGNGIFVESTGNAFVVGTTTSPNFPTVSPMQATLNGFKNAFVAKFNPSGQPIFSSYLGGNGSDLGLAIAADSNHRAYVTGQTSSSNFPGVSGNFQSTLSGTDAFVSRFSADGSALEYSTYLGGTNDNASGNGIAVDSSLNVYIAGDTSSSTFPLKNAAQSTFAGRTAK